MQELILEEKTTLSPVMKEIYRRLRTNLEFTGIENKVICLTSCMENDGKSSVSFNLAKILAENDKRVLFIDADMRNSVLTKRTGIPDDLKGLSHYLAGKISKDKKLMDVMPVSDLKDELNLEETPIVTGECADIISDYINVSHKVQEIYRQYQIYQEALGEWIHYDLDEDNHLVKKYSGAVIDKVTVNKMTKNILHEGMLLVRKAGAFVQKLGLQNETDFLADSMGDNLGFEFMVLAAIYMDHGHWAVEFENGDSFYNLLEMCTVLRTADEEDSADLLKTFTLLKNEMEEQGMDIRHIDHYNMLRNYIYTVADIYKIFFDAIQKKLEAMVVEIDSLVDKNPDFIATEGKFKGCIFYQTDTDSNRVDVFDPSGNIMADFSIFQNEAIRNYEKTRLGIQGAVEHN